MALQSTTQQQDLGLVYTTQYDLSSIIGRYLSVEEILEQFGISFDQLDAVATAEAQRILTLIPQSVNWQ